MTTINTQLVIIGSGPAGYAAAIYAARADLKPYLITGLQPGGQLMITTDVENYPGYVEPILGPELMDHMQKQSARFGVNSHQGQISAVDFSRRPFWLKTDNKQEFLAESVIIATGAQAKWLTIPGEDTFKGYGISACATCDAFFFRDQKVAVIGGGNTAVEEALFLSKFAKNVTLIHRRDSLRAEQILQKRLFADPKISVLWNSSVLAFEGTTKPQPYLKQMRLLDNLSQKEHIADIDGVFVAIGHSPATEVFRNHIALDEHGYITTQQPGSPLTAIKGIYAAGDVMDSKYRQAVTAAGFGCMAALAAEQELAGHAD